MYELLFIVGWYFDAYYCVHRRRDQIFIYTSVTPILIRNLIKLKLRYSIHMYDLLLYNIHIYKENKKLFQKITLFVWLEKQINESSF